MPDPVDDVAAGYRPAEDDLVLPAVQVEADSRYVLDFPFIVTVTFVNGPEGAEFYTLPELSFFYTRGPMAIELAPVDGGPTSRVGPFPEVEGEPVASGTLLTGQERRMVLDLDTAGPRVGPGIYRLTMTLNVSGSTRVSEPVVIELLAPSPEEAAESERLRSLGTSPGWVAFLRANWNTVEPAATLRPEVAWQLWPYLFLHRVFYGPEGVSSFDPASLDAVRGRAWASEARVWQYELLRARGDASTCERLRAAIESEWPGLRERLDEVDRDDGFLTRGRRVYGAAQEPFRRPAWTPYTPLP